MLDIQQKIRSLLKYTNKNQDESVFSPKRLSGKGCQIDEDCDLFGFSNVPTHRYSSNGVSLSTNSPPNIVHLLREDANWHNPSSVDLMMQAYEIHQPHKICNSLVGHDRLVCVKYSIDEIRKNQHRYFSARCLEEGLDLYQKNSKLSQVLDCFNESIRFDSMNSDAYFQRASIFYKLKDWVNAEKDAKHLLSLVPDHKAGHLLLIDIQEKVAMLDKYINESNINYAPSTKSMMDSVRRSLGKNLEDNRSGSDSGGFSGHKNVEKDDSNSTSTLTSDSSDRKSRKKKSKKRKKKHSHHKKSSKKHRRNRDRETTS